MNGHRKYLDELNTRLNRLHVTFPAVDALFGWVVRHPAPISPPPPVPVPATVVYERTGRGWFLGWWPAVLLAVLALFLLGFGLMYFLSGRQPVTVQVIQPAGTAQTAGATTVPSGTAGQGTSPATVAPSATTTQTPGETTPAPTSAPATSAPEPTPTPAPTQPRTTAAPATVQFQSGCSLNQIPMYPQSQYEPDVTARVVDGLTLISSTSNQAGFAMVRELSGRGLTLRDVRVFSSTQGNSKILDFYRSTAKRLDCLIEKDIGSSIFLRLRDPDDTFAMGIVPFAKGDLPGPDATVSGYAIFVSYR